MTCQELIRQTLKLADSVAMAYLSDLSDQQMMLRPHGACNTIHWQVGHLILSEHQHINRIEPNAMPALPAGFSEIFHKDSTRTETHGHVLSKQDLLLEFQAQRRGTLELLAKQSDQDLDLPTGVPYAATRAALFHMQGAHWLMHCGQWVIVRRQNNLPVVI